MCDFKGSLQPSEPQIVCGSNQSSPFLTGNVQEHDHVLVIEGFLVDDTGFACAIKEEAQNAIAEKEEHHTREKMRKHKTRYNTTHKKKNTHTHTHTTHNGENT
jgi:hypothetical protein